MYMLRIRCALNNRVVCCVKSVTFALEILCCLSKFFKNYWISPWRSSGRNNDFVCALALFNQKAFKSSNVGPKFSLKGGANDLPFILRILGFMTTVHIMDRTMHTIYKLAPLWPPFACFGEDMTLFSFSVTSFPTWGRSACHDNATVEIV